jgi:hypothetical protein
MLRGSLPGKHYSTEVRGRTILHGMRGNLYCNRRIVLVAIAFALTIRPAVADQDLPAQAALIIDSPDLAINCGYQLTTRAEVLDKILDEPIHLMRLWKAYRFAPHYEARAIAQAVGQGGLHVDDPTGIQGEISPAGLSAGRRLYVASGAIAHRLVPHFKGKAVLVIDETAESSGVRLRIDLYLRMESRFIGFLMQPFVPYLRTLVLRRLGSNIADIGTILADLSERPAEAAARLSPEDSAALLELLAAR